MAGMSYTPDGLLHVWECPFVLSNPRLGIDTRCGYIQAEPGECPYDHEQDEPVVLVEVVAIVQCSDCGNPIRRDDSRAPDDRLICEHCALSYIGKYELDADLELVAKLEQLNPMGAYRQLLPLDPENRAALSATLARYAGHGR